MSLYRGMFQIEFKIIDLHITAGEIHLLNLIALHCLPLEHFANNSFSQDKKTIECQKSNCGWTKYSKRQRYNVQIFKQVERYSQLIIFD